MSCALIRSTRPVFVAAFVCVTCTARNRMSCGVCLAAGALAGLISLAAIAAGEAKDADKTELISLGKIGQDQELQARIDECLEQGAHEEAVRMYDQILEEMPDYGIDDGSIITLKYHRAVAHGFEKYSPEKRALFEEIWSDYEDSSYHQLYNIGRMVILYYMQAEDYLGARDFSERLIAKLEENYEYVPQDARQRYGVDTAYQEGLYYQGSALFKLGLYDSAIESYEKLLRLFPDSVVGKSAADELHEVMHRASDEEMKRQRGALLAGTDDNNAHSHGAHAVQGQAAATEEDSKGGSARELEEEPVDRSHAPAPEGPRTSLGLEKGILGFLVALCVCACVAGSYWWKRT